MVDHKPLMISVVVPAYNEERVIGRCLTGLTDGMPPEGVEVIVVCNGCTDRTADVARQHGRLVQVIETTTPGKSNALSLGDAKARGFPRFFVDADVLVTFESLRRMAHRLAAGDVMAVSPAVQWNLDSASWAVRAFYDIDRRLPSHHETIGGSGVYGLSEAGHQRIGKFPDLTADDAYVRRSFTASERLRVAEAVSVVTPPKSLAGVIAIKTRSHFGNYELSQRFPHLSANSGPGNCRALMRLCLLPWLWPRLAIYGYVKVVARLVSRWRIRSGKYVKWARDETSRAEVGHCRLAVRTVRSVNSRVTASR